MVKSSTAETVKLPPVRRLSMWFSRVVRRRFFRVFICVVLLVFFVVSAVVMYVFRPATVNGLLKDALEVALVEGAEFSFNEEATRVDYPGLDGRGTVVIEDLEIQSTLDNYTLLKVSRVDVSYDLFASLKFALLGVRSSPVTRVVLGEGTYAAVHIDDNWRLPDLKIFEPGDDDDDATPDLYLPEVIVRNAACHIYAPVLFSPPSDQVADTLVAGERFRFQGESAYYVRNINLTLRTNSANPERMDIEAGIRCDFWGETTAAGWLSRSLRDTRGEVSAVRLNQSVSQREAALLKAEYAQYFDYFFADSAANTADATFALSFDNDGVDYEITGVYSGAAMYSGYPLSVQNSTARVRFNGNDLIIEEVRGQRNGGSVRLSGEISNIVDADSLAFRLSIDVKNLALTPDITNALRGVLNESGERVFPEWERFKRSGSKTQPAPTDVIDLLASQLAPSGVTDLRIELSSSANVPGTRLDLKCMLYDVSAQYRGSHLADIEAGVVTSQPQRAAENPLLASLARLDEDGDHSEKQETWEPAFGGFPLPLYGLQGVVEGVLEPGGGGWFNVRGFDEEEASVLRQTRGIEVTPNELAARATRADRAQQLLVGANIEIGKDSDDTSLRLDIGLQSPNLIVDDLLVAYLPPSLRASLRRIEAGNFGIEILKPRADVEIRGVQVGVVQTRGVSAPEVTVSVDCRVAQADLTLKAEGADAPFTINDVEFNVAVNVQGGEQYIRVGDLRASFLDGAELTCESLQIDARARPRPRVDGTFEVSNVSLGGALLSRLPKSIADGIRAIFSRETGEGSQLDLSGRLDLTIELLRVDSGFGTKLNVVAKLRDAAMSLAPAAPLGLKDVFGTLAIRDSEYGFSVEILQLTGKLRHETTSDGRGTVRVQGLLLISPDFRTGDIELSVEAQQILLAETLQETANKVLGAKQGEDSGVVGVWKQLEPDGGNGRIGRVDASANVGGRIPLDGSDFDTSTLTYLVDVELEQGRLEYEGFRLPLVEVESRLTLTPEGVGFSGLSAKIAPEFTDEKDPGTITIGGIDITGDVVTVSVATQRLRLNDKLAEALPPEIRTVHQTLEPNGLLSGTVSLTVSGSKRLDYDVNAEVSQMSLTLGLQLNDIKGAIDIAGSLYSTEGSESDALSKHTMHGRVAFEEVYWDVVAVKNLTSSVVFSDGVLELPNVRGDIHGGQLRARVNVSAGIETTYHATIQAQGVSLESITSGAEWAQRDNEKLSGGLDATVEVYSENEEGLIGKGRIDVGREPLSEDQLQNIESVSEDKRGGSPASLGRVPIFDGLYSALDFEAGEAFDEAHLIFFMRPNSLVIRELNLISDSIRIETSSLQENEILFKSLEGEDQINVVLVPTIAPRMLTIPVLPSVLDAVKGLLLRIYVAGTLDKPVVTPLTSKASYGKDDKDVRPEYSPPDD